MLPTEIDHYMRRFVIGQQEVLRFVSVAIYKHLAGERFGNLMMIGNSGSGKTTVMRAMERLYADHDDFAQYRVVVILNANTFATDEGVVDTTRLFQTLEERARQILGDDAPAEEIARYMEHATVCLDEVDKVSGVVGGKPYVTGINIQQALLTMIEGERVVWELNPRKRPTSEVETVDINTGKMLFLCAGAFEKLYDQVFDRVTSPTSRVKLPTETVIEDGEVDDPTGGWLRDAAANIAHRAVRNRGTLGGSLAHADPAADWVIVMTGLDATIIVDGDGGRREIAAGDFFTGPFETALRSGELIRSVRVTQPGAGTKWGYWKFVRQVGEFAKASATVLLDPQRDAPRIAVGALGREPLVLGETAAQQLAAGQATAQEVLRAAMPEPPAESLALHAAALNNALAQAAASQPASGGR